MIYQRNLPERRRNFTEFICLLWVMWTSSVRKKMFLMKKVSLGILSTIFKIIILPFRRSLNYILKKKKVPSILKFVFLTNGEKVCNSSKDDKISWLNFQKYIWGIPVSVAQFSFLPAFEQIWLNILINGLCIRWMNWIIQPIYDFKCSPSPTAGAFWEGEIWALTLSVYSR